MTFAKLYMIAWAKPVRPMTAAKWASIQAALTARRMCPQCREESPTCIRRSIGMCEACQYTHDLWDAFDDRHDYVIGEPTVQPGDLDVITELFFAESGAMPITNALHDNRINAHVQKGSQ